MQRFTVIFIALALLLPLGLSHAQPAAAQEGGGYATCTAAPRLSLGTYGRVSIYPPLANRMRGTPGYGSPIIGRIPPGGTFYIHNSLGSIQCMNGIYWYYVNYDGMWGWTAESNGAGQYWLEPAYSTPPPPACALVPRLVPGRYGQITPGLPNVLRTAPGTTASGANSRVIGQIPGLGVFYVISGPYCGPDGRNWWYVNYNGVAGYTAEGEGNTYWAVPLQ